MPLVHVDLGPRGYDIHIGQATPGLGTVVRSLCRGNLALLIADRNTAIHAARVAEACAEAKICIESVTLPPGEERKSLAGASLLYDRLAEVRADRKTLVIAVGGGVIGDLAGFVAATFNRGLDLFMVPTTLLAMVDSSVGGKVGINHPRGKNLIGAFHQPVGVWIDTAHLATLADREFVSGLAEVVKYGIILDADLLAYLEANTAGILRRDPDVIAAVVTRCCRLKANVVERDERELTGLRAILNHGHTFAHAFETVAGYGTWLHGEAVAAGMICASRLAERRGLVDGAFTDRQRRLLEGFGLPATIPSSWPIDSLIDVMRNDKKAEQGRLRFLLPVRAGEVRLVEDVTADEVAQVLQASQGHTEPGLIA